AAGELRQVRVRARGLIVESLEQHWDDAPDMGNDIFDVRVALWHAPGDQVEDNGAVLERGADGDGEPVVVDQGRADAVLEGGVVEHGTASVHLLIERLELCFRGGAVEAGAGHRHAEHAELVQPALHLGQGALDGGGRRGNGG